MAFGTPTMVSIKDKWPFIGKEPIESLRDHLASIHGVNCHWASFPWCKWVAEWQFGLLTMVTMEAEWPFGTYPWCQWKPINSTMVKERAKWCCKRKPNDHSASIDTHSDFLRAQWPLNHGYINGVKEAKWPFGFHSWCQMEAEWTFCP